MHLQAGTDQRRRGQRLARVGMAFMLMSFYWILVRLRPQALLKGAVAVPPPPLDPRVVPPARSLFNEIISAVERAADLHPLRPGCLERALACRRLMRFHGQQASVVVGVAMRDATIDAHAWVESDRLANDASQAAFTQLMRLR